MVEQSNLMPGQLPGYARVWLRLCEACCELRTAKEEQGNAVLAIHSIVKAV